MSNAKLLTVILAGVAAVLAVTAAWMTQNWMPAVMVAPVAIIAVLNWPSKG